jgi:hypothetical protein
MVRCRAKGPRRVAVFLEEVAMARWSITRRSDGHLELAHHRSGALGVFRCGALHSWTSTADILAWIVEQDATACCDVVTTPEGAVVVLPAAIGKN